MSTPHKKNILVTGGAGFIGSAITEKLAADPSHNVIVIDNLLTGDEKRVTSSGRPNISFIRGNVNSHNDISAIFLSNRIDYVFHYAAVVGVQRTLQNPVMVLKDILGMRHITSLAKTAGVKRIFFSSSSEVYGEPVEFPQNEETTPLNSRLPYAIVKNAGEAFLKAFRQEFGLHYTIFRFFNTYGPQQSSDFVMSKFLRAALKNEPLYIHGDGSQSRTFCYIDDNTDACLSAFYGNKCVDEVVNIGNDNEISILDLARTIIRVTGSRSEIIHGPALKEGDMTRRRPDVTKMKQLLGRDMLPLEEGIRRILNDPKFIS
ncbi:MAG TPA: NAD-dependent epimerase/dehydratase family protein [Bacteroidia bacterium]|nr:NAD-dependent epimerase/dehydratase family protein [Bacteroidia bacterium]